MAKVSLGMEYQQYTRGDEAREPGGKRWVSPFLGEQTQTTEKVN